MFTKILVCSLVVGCVSALTSLFDRSAAGSSDETVQLPSCGTGVAGCAGMQPRASTDRFLAMLAAN